MKSFQLEIMERVKNCIDEKTATVDINRYMLELLRSAVLNQEPLVPIDIQLDWDTLKTVSASHGILAWVWDGICRLPETQRPNKFQRIGWALSAQEIYDRYERQKVVLNDLISLFKENGVQLILLKGISLSVLYPKPQCRPSGDIDIYMFHDFEKGNALLGIGGKEAKGLHTDCDYKGVHIENHKILVFPNTKIKRRINRYLIGVSDKTILYPEGYYSLPCIPNYIYLMFHALNHVDFNGNNVFLNIRSVLDLGMYLDRNQDKMPVVEMKNQIRVLHLEKSFDLVLYLSEWLLGISFEQYHFGLIKNKDLVAVREFLERGYAMNISSELPWWQQFAQKWNHYVLAMHTYKYMPRRNNSFLLATVHQMGAIFVRGIFRIPQNQPVHGWLRRR